jgi:hypothetical protein
LGCLVDGNRAWAQHAPVLAVSVLRLAFTSNGAPNRHLWHDAAAAMLADAPGSPLQRGAVLLVVCGAVNIPCTVAWAGSVPRCNAGWSNVGLGACSTAA